MVEVFKTNVEDSMQAELLLALLHDHLPFAEINFDLEDCDNVLRVKGDEICPITVIKIMEAKGFECYVLD
ncbi:hypothetical protein KXD93_24775 [Mucilaginibacter sp. BJC16-A38]|uniref:hypothetical protein n=1 Tax=Mucilaginibacter phenanthrenivorans TaxID=1234842 RepID=UPI002157C9A3|nr:hypothetical protein [Mucilaginibacter phenanthrenivorans]MCR8560895.1 hypothetical protein [Mucilaginibacter phenanthrenivorans]